MARGKTLTKKGFQTKVENAVRNVEIVTTCSRDFVGIGLKTSSSAMAERPRDESAILRGWVTLRLNIRLNGYVSCQYPWIIRWENCNTTTLLLEVFTQRNFVADCI